MHSSLCKGTVQGHYNGTVHAHKLIGMSEGAQLVIPLVVKHQNHVEKYVSKFKSMDGRNSRINAPLCPEQHDSSAFQPIIQDEELKEMSRKCYVQYQPRAGKSKLEAIEEAEAQYLSLKSHMQPVQKSLPGARSSGRHSSPVSAEAIQSLVKKATVTEDGHEFFADLYFIKKTREKVFKQVILADKQTSVTMPLSRRHKAVQDEDNSLLDESTFATGQILKQRDQKKLKMLKGRKMHWGVYYEMLTLPTYQRRNVQRQTTFAGNYGID